VCPDCWKIIAFAVKFLDSLLREKFGFEQLFWIFSGRRGAHCWVLDKAASRYSPSYRTAIVSYLTQFEMHADHRVYTGNCAMAKNLIETSFGFQFEELLKSDALRLGSAKTNAYIFKIVHRNFQNKTLTHALVAASSSGKSNIAIWNEYRAAIRRYHPSPVEVLQTLVLSMLFPRIDAAVTVDPKHLIKCPFSWHPRTGNVCVPISVQHVESFNPLQAPNISRPESFYNFSTHRLLLYRAVQDMTPIGQKFICLQCPSLLIPITELSHSIVFNNAEHLLEHCTDFEHPNIPSPDTSRICDLVRIKCANSEAHDRDRLKMLFYDQLSSKFD
jgi:DNA primase catalytic subunit